MSPELIRLLTTWVLPPVLGAIIGYVTNDIAIRMLFRPLEEWRILGIRVPLTPGIIPKQRLALAESIGRMVSEHLITEDAIREHLTADSFRSSLRASIGSLTQRALAASPSSLTRSAQGLWNGSLRALAGGILGRFLRSTGFLASVRSVVARLVAALGDRLLSDIASSEGLKKLARTRVVPLLAGGKAAGWVRSAVARWAGRHVTENTPLEQLLPDAAVEGLTDALRAAYPSIRRALLAFLRAPGARRELETRGRQFLHDVLDRLNSLQRFFVSMAQYDRTLHEKMPEIVDDALGHIEAFLEDPASADRFADSVRSALQGLRRKGLRDLGAEWGIDLEKRLPALAERLAGAIDAERLAQLLEDGLDRFFEENGTRSLRELAGRLLGLQEHEVVDGVSNAVLDYLTREETAERLTETLEGFLGGLLSQERPIGELIGIDAAGKASIDEFLNERARDLLEARLPEFVQGFDIRRMVVDRINKLDVAQVESLLVMVIAKHLKWINIFGALLGALIGTIQSVVSVLT
jgi:uncharacterized membrane protein YheB (UPF0754 family)